MLTVRPNSCHLFFAPSSTGLSGDVYYVTFGHSKTGVCENLIARVPTHFAEELLFGSAGGDLTRDLIAERNMELFKGRKKGIYGEASNIINDIYKLMDQNSSLTSTDGTSINAFQSVVKSARLVIAYFNELYKARTLYDNICSELIDVL